MTLAVRTVRDIGWSWEGEPAFWPSPYARLALDPTPGYAHDARLVRAVLRRVNQAFPHEGRVAVHLLPHEGTCRTNGQTTTRYGKGGMIAAHDIVLFGKRIPPHYAMTRYLVAHEYGHCVDDWIAKRLGMERDTDLIAEYAKVRRMKGRPMNGTPGRWHEAVGEVFACDFRVLVTGVEADYWPHPGITPPQRNASVRAWWAREATL